LTPEQIRAMRSGSPMPMHQQMIGDGSQMSPQDMQRQMQMEEAMYNPMMGMGGAPDIRRVDRWLQYKVPDEETSGKFWLTETTLAEELAKGNLTKEEYNWIVREYAEIEAIAGGDGNGEWVKSRQRKLMLRLNMTRSRSDNPEKGLRDGTLLMAQNVNQKSDVKMPGETMGDSNTGGFFGLLRRGK
jgi:hypothetical protein